MEPSHYRMKTASEQGKLRCLRFGGIGEPIAPSLDRAM